MGGDYALDVVAAYEQHPKCPMCGVLATMHSSNVYSFQCACPRLIIGGGGAADGSVGS